MITKIRFHYPSTFKYKLFISFILFILIPVFIISIFAFDRMQSLLQTRYNEKAYYELETMNRSLEDLLGVVFRTSILLNNDDKVPAILKSPDQFSDWDRLHYMENKFSSINNSLFLSSPKVFYTLLDNEGHVYTSYQPEQSLVYSQLRDQYSEWIPESNASGVWIMNDANNVDSDISDSRYLLSFLTPIYNAFYDKIGMARISIDYQEWFQNSVKSAPDQQDFYMLDRLGNVIIQTETASAVSESFTANLLSKDNATHYYLDRSESTLYNYTYIPSIQCYLVNKIPTSLIYSEISRLKWIFLSSLVLLIFVFMIVTFVISSSLTKPLQFLTKSMSEIVQKNLKLQLPEQKLQGEILGLTQSFNKMVRDMNELMQKLWQEEKQKQTQRFQLLLSQMNPHFLFNTLTTIKWIAFNKGDKEIPQICESLGTLLDSGLRLDEDLLLLHKELDLAQSYVYIQKLRYNQKFTFQVEIDSRLHFALVPKLSFQPLIENAIHHGISPMAEAGHIQLRVYAKDAMLFMEIEDNGVGLEAARNAVQTRNREGVALKNMKERLQLLFPSTGSFQLIALAQGTLARIVIPLLISQPYEKGDTPDVDSSNR